MPFKTTNRTVDNHSIGTQLVYKPTNTICYIYDIFCGAYIIKKPDGSSFDENDFRDTIYVGYDITIANEYEVLKDRRKRIIKEL